jgi:hypothetical protein
VESFFATALLEPLKINQSMINQRRSPPSSKTRLSMTLKIEALADGSTPRE